MRVKRFTGNTMQEAVEQLRTGLGRDAVILHTKQKRRGLFGRFGRMVYEVIGAIDPASNQPKTPPPKQAGPAQQPMRPSAPTKPGELIWPDSIETVHQRLISAGIPKDM